jgi:hypothetical protein
LRSNPEGVDYLYTGQPHAVRWLVLVNCGSERSLEELRISGEVIAQIWPIRTEAHALQREYDIRVEAITKSSTEHL